MENLIEDLLIDFVNNTSEHFNLDFEDALAAVSQTKVANNLVDHGIPDNKSTDELLSDLFDEIAKGY